MEIKCTQLKRVYGKRINTIAADEQFYQVPGATGYILSTYCRLFKKTMLGRYKAIELEFECGQPWREYEIKFDGENVPRRLSINRLAGLVFFPDVPNAFLEPYHDDWEWRSWKVENLHLFKGDKNQRREQRVESIRAKCEGREPNYDEELKHQTFVGGFNLPKGIKLNKKMNRDYQNMRSRCVNQKVKDNNPQYQETRICDKWLENPDAFKEWWIANRYDYPEPLQLDKDILSFGKTNTYAPEHCCFVPRRINDIFTRSNSKLKYAITKRTNQDGTVLYIIAPNAFGYGKTYSTRNYSEALIEGRRRKALMIKRIATEEQEKGLMPKYITDALFCWAKLTKIGKAEMFEPSEKTLKEEGIF